MNRRPLLRALAACLALPFMPKPLRVTSPDPGFWICYSDSSAIPQKKFVYCSDDLARVLQRAARGEKVRIAEFIGDARI